MIAVLITKNTAEVSVDVLFKVLLYLFRFALVIDCRVSEWQPWSECNATCGLGHMSRVRRVLTAARNGGKECPDLHQQRACNGQKCEIKDDDKAIRESAIILQSSFSTHRNVDQEQDIRRNLRLNYPKDPLRENVDE